MTVDTVTGEIAPYQVPERRDSLGRSQFLNTEAASA